MVAAEPTDLDIARVLTDLVPLSRLMAEQIAGRLGPRDVPGWPPRLPLRPGSGSWPWSRRAFRQRACRKVGSFFSYRTPPIGSPTDPGSLTSSTLPPCSLMPKLNHPLSSNEAITARPVSRQLRTGFLRWSSLRLNLVFRPWGVEWRSTNELHRNNLHK